MADSGPSTIALETDSTYDFSMGSQFGKKLAESSTASATSGVRTIGGVSKPTGPVSGFIPAVGGRGPSSAPASGPVSQRKGGPVSQGGLGPRILLIDDDNLTRSKLEQMLSKRGAEVISASGPSEAMYLLSAVGDAGRRPTMVLLDVLMPGFDGPLFIKMLRADPRFAGAPIVLISALSAPALEQTMRDWQADGFILKSRGLLHIDEAFSAWFDRMSSRISGSPVARRTGPPSSSSVG